MYVLYIPNAASTVATIATSEMSSCNSELLQTLKALTSQVASLTMDINTIKARPAHEEAQHHLDNYEANSLSQQPQNRYKEPIRTRYQQQPQNNFFRQPAPIYFQRPPSLNTQANTGHVWKSQPNAAGQFSRPPRSQSSNWQQQPQQGHNKTTKKRAADYSGPINAQGLCPYHQQFGSQARN